MANEAWSLISLFQPLGLSFFCFVTVSVKACYGVLQHILNSKLAKPEWSRPLSITHSGTSMHKRCVPFGISNVAYQYNTATFPLAWSPKTVGLHLQLSFSPNVSRSAINCWWTLAILESTEGNSTGEGTKWLCIHCLQGEQYFYNTFTCRYIETVGWFVMLWCAKQWKASKRDLIMVCELSAAVIVLMLSFVDFLFEKNSISLLIALCFSMLLLLMLHELAVHVTFISAQFL